jgi:hemin uptake protein HemP
MIVDLSSREYGTLARNGDACGRIFRAKDWHVTSGPHDTREVARPPAAPGGKPRRLKVSEIMEGEREAILEHDGQEYRLRITASGKLILTK